MSAMDFSALPTGAPTRQSHMFDVQRVGVGPIYAVVFIGIAGGLGLALMRAAVGAFTRAGKESSGLVWTIGWTASVLAILIGVVSLAVLVVRALAARGRRTAPDSLAAFARANGLSYSPQSAAPAYPGAIFGAGTMRQAFDQLTSTQGRIVEIGNIEYEIPAGRTAATRSWGYIAIQLDRRLPHILLESTEYGQNTAGALPVAVDRSQRLGLEGDFDRYFTLYCPEGFQTDALYLLTPDLMALLVDKVAGFDVEIIDDWLFVYSPTDFSTAGQAEYRRLFGIIEVVEAKAVDQAAHYTHDDAQVAAIRSEQVATTAVAASSVRLTASTSQFTRLFRISLAVLILIVLAFGAGIVIVSVVAGPPI